MKDVSVNGRKHLGGKGRVAKKLGISVAERCDFACLFCMPWINGGWAKPRNMNTIS